MGLVFTYIDGRGVEPDWFSDRFGVMVKAFGLPPVSVHDVRHGATSRALAAGVDFKFVSETLGHSGTAITQDLYTSVYDPLKHAAAQAIATTLAAAAPPRPRTAGEAPAA